jgi:hypothetical protein
MAHHYGGIFNLYNFEEESLMTATINFQNINLVKDAQGTVTGADVSTTISFQNDGKYSSTTNTIRLTKDELDATGFDAAKLTNVLGNKSADSLTDIAADLKATYPATAE